MAKPFTSLFMRERNPVPPGRGSLMGSESLEVACPPLSMTAGPCVSQDMAENTSWEENRRLPLAGVPT